MPLKPRMESDELKIWRILNTRMDLTEKEKKYYLNKEKGYEGEVQFDLLTEKLTGQQLILNDLLLEVNNTKFQIDSTIFAQETINLFEVKNYEGDYLYNNEKFYTISEKEIQNPLDQLKRCESLLRQLLQNLGMKIPIQGWLIFINPEFTLYQAPQNRQIIFPSQLNRFMKNFNSKPSKLNKMQIELAKRLVSLHQIESPYKRLRHYDFAQLRKGNICTFCHSLMTSVRGTKVICGACGGEEKLDSAVLRNVEEFKLLFPDKKITTSGIYEWCKFSVSKKVIQKNLKLNYRSVGCHRGFYYE
jgi:hypothetical protein